MSALGWKALALLAIHNSPRARRWAAALAPRQLNEDVTAERWDREYDGGAWDRLRGLDEAARYHVIAAFQEQLKPGAHVLDVGCGEGLLTPYLRRAGYARYLGMDGSATAIARASAQADSVTRFERIDGDALATTERFDVIIFNEVLYYFADPCGTVGRLGSLLNPGGVVIVSMALFGFRSGLFTLRLWRDIERTHAVLHEVAIHTPRSASWLVKVLGPQGLPAAASDHGP